MRAGLSYKTFYPPPDPELLRRAGLVCERVALALTGTSSPSSPLNKGAENGVRVLLTEADKRLHGRLRALLGNRTEAFVRVLRELAERSLPFYGTAKCHSSSGVDWKRGWFEAPDRAGLETEFASWNHLLRFGALWNHLFGNEPYPFAPGSEAERELREFLERWWHQATKGRALRRKDTPHLAIGASLAKSFEFLKVRGLERPGCFAPNGAASPYLKWKFLRATYVSQQTGGFLVPEHSPLVRALASFDLEVPLETLLVEGQLLEACMEPYEAEAREFGLKWYERYLEYASQGLLLLAKSFVEEGSLVVPPEVPTGHVHLPFLPGETPGGHLLRYVGRWANEAGEVVEVYDAVSDVGLALLGHEAHFGEALHLVRFGTAYTLDPRSETWVVAHALDRQALYAVRSTATPFGNRLAGVSLRAAALEQNSGMILRGFEEGAVQRELALKVERVVSLPPTLPEEGAQAFAERVSAMVAGTVAFLQGLESLAPFPTSAHHNWEALRVAEVAFDGRKLRVRLDPPAFFPAFFGGLFPQEAVFRTSWSPEEPFPYKRPLLPYSLEMELYGDPVTLFLLEWAQKEDPGGLYALVLPQAALASGTAVSESYHLVRFTDELNNTPRMRRFIDTETYHASSNGPIEVTERGPLEGYLEGVKALERKWEEKIPEPYGWAFLYGFRSEAALRIASAQLPKFSPLNKGRLLNTSPWNFEEALQAFDGLLEGAIEAYLLAREKGVHPVPDPFRPALKRARCFLTERR